MKKNTLFILAGFIVVFLVIGILVSQDDTPDELAMAGKTFYPELLKKLNDVDTIEIKNNKESTSVKKGSDGKWNILQKDSYPADQNKVKSILVASADMEIIEPKTKKPELHKRLGLQDPEKEGSESALITLKAKDQVLSQYLVGKINTSKDGKTVYVRKKGDDQTWLVKASLSPPKFSTDWLVKEILKIDDKRVQRVSLKFPDNKTLSIKKENKGDTNYKIENLAKNKEVESTFTVNNIAYSLAKLNIEDVSKQSNVDFAKNSLFTGTLETYDGMRISFAAAEHNDKKYMKLSASLDETLVSVDVPPKPAEATKKEEENQDEKNTKDKDKENQQKNQEALEKLKKETIEKVKKEIDELNSKWQGWAYSISSSTIGNINKRKNDLLKKPQKAKPQK